jgi:hypothetical protein
MLIDQSVNDKTPKLLENNKRGYFHVGNAFSEGIKSTNHKRKGW